MKIEPTCNRRSCFACEGRKCTVLTNNKFGSRKCPFYKTKEQAEEEKKLYPQVHDNNIYKED